MRTPPPGTGPSEAHRATGLRDRVGSLQPRLWAVETLVGWVPSFVGSRLRTQALRAAGVRIGDATLFFGLPTLVGTGAVHTRLSIGAHCGFNVGAVFDLEEAITIGDHVAVGHEVMFLTRSHRTGSSEQRAGAPACAPVVVGDGAWLGARSVVLPGVTVGAGSVIAAGVIVAEDVPENTLLTGTQKVNLARWRQ
jgi:maltose O-acetyltransferase